MSSMSRKYISSVLAAFAGMIGSMAPAQAEERGVAFAGGVASKSPSVYVGAVTALPGAALGRGLAVRTVVSRSDYRYDRAADTVKGKATSITVSAIHQWSGEWGYASAGVGVAHQKTRLSPDDANNRNRGSKWNAVVSADGVRNLGTWQLGASGSYRFGIKEYYVRGDVTRSVSSAVRIGAEATAQGDPSYERQLYGAVIAVRPSAKWEVRLSGGGIREDSRNVPYAALSISRVF